MTKRAGCCSNCDKPIFAPVEERGGEIVKSAGLMDEEAVRIGFVLTNGSRIEMSVCGDCLDTYDLKTMWRKNCEAWSNEINDKNRDVIAKLVQEVPVGELYRQRWKDMANARLR